VLAVLAVLASPAAATPAPTDGGVALQPSPRLAPLPRGQAQRMLPIILRAQRIRSQPDLLTEAEGEVEFRRGGLVIRADKLTHDVPLDTARALGDVRIERDGATYRGPALELQVQRFEGFFLQPEFDLPALGARGSAERIDFIDASRSRALQAEYTSCPRPPADADGAPLREPDWVLRTRSVELDFERNEGVATGAELRFLGTRLIALPTLSFPLGDTRRSGWLPPSINIDNRSGIELAVPWYWNIAPQRDATLTPRLITRRGLGLDSEFRYLSDHHEGSINLDWLPRDAVADRSREALHWLHEARLARGLQFSAEVLRVSDDDWWKDFPNASRSLTTRLLPMRLALERPFSALGAAGTVQGSVYARSLHWQVLQGAEAFMDAPYQRSPQLGVRLDGAAHGLQWSLEGEYNRFTLPHGQAAASVVAGTVEPGRPTGERMHLLAALSRPVREPGWWVVPELALNLARYHTERDGLPGVAKAQRAIPTFSVDAGVMLERETEAFGRRLVQTLEPRVLYAYTPFRDQSGLPNYDAAAKDFNFVSIYTPNAFSGVDRVSDAHQVTAGVTTRLLDARSGAEALRLGLVQRYLLRTQRQAPQADGSPDGPPLEQRFSDALLLGSTSVLPGWTLDGAVQYSPDLQRSVRTIASARWQPGPYRTVGATYRLARGLSEQLELGWQWPLNAAPRAGTPGPEGPASGATAALQRLGAPTRGCGGTWYAVGRINYSLNDSRVTDSVLGLEYDAGCWIGRIVAERLSTGQREATTRLLLQLELVGLSRLGSNPLKVLKDNIPGYRLLRDERGSFPAAGD
jgi:LPS-assembly protein